MTHLTKLHKTDCPLQTVFVSHNRSLTSAAAVKRLTVIPTVSLNALSTRIALFLMRY